VKKIKDNTKIKDIDSIPEAIAFGTQKTFQALDSWGKTIRLSVIIIAVAGAAVAAKFVWGLLR